MSIRKAVIQGVDVRVVREISPSNADADADVNSGETGASRFDVSEILQPLLSRSDTAVIEPDATWTNSGVPPGAPSRLLLVSEGLAGRGISYLPKIVRVLMGTCPPDGGLKAVEGAALVACELTLGFDYWTADEAVGYMVSNGGARVRVEYVGHVAVLYGGGEDLERKQMIGQVRSA